MGYGVVGGGVAAVIKQNNEIIKKKCGRDSVEVKYILDLRTFPGDENESKIISDFNTIVNDSEIEIVVETMGGLHPAYEFVSACLNAGKSVVTSNKELVAMKGDELLEIAGSKNVNFMFEAAVGGGIPIIRPLIDDLTANEITEVAGILNGTTNFILTKMIEEGVKFEDALKTAQQLGYAEKDPTADVEGLDAARKICILAALCFGTHIYPDSVDTAGITKVTLEDVKAAEKFGGVIKLIARSKKLPCGRVSASVSPTVVPAKSQLGAVTDVFNAVMVKGNAVDSLVFYGRGAGKMPTASAVVADVVDCARYNEKRKDFGWEKAKENYVAPIGDTDSSFLVRCRALDEIAAISEISAAFSGNESVKGNGKMFITSLDNGEILFETGVEKEKNITEKLSQMKTVEILSKYRVMKA